MENEKRKDAALNKVEKIADEKTAKPRAATFAAVKPVKKKRATESAAAGGVTAREKREEAAVKKLIERQAAKEKKQADKEKRRAAKLLGEEKRKTKAEKRKAVKAEKAAAKRRRVAEKRARRIAQKAEKSANGKKGVGGWIAAVATLSCATLILATLLTAQLSGRNFGRHPAADASASAARSFYDFVGFVDGMETDMSKIFVSTDDGGRQRLLCELSLKSNLADSALTQLPIADESKFYTSKYVNQVGDYAKYLNNRLISGERLTEKDMSDLRGLYEINRNLKTSLSALADSIGENYDFKNLADNNAEDVIIKRFGRLEESAADYPQMIYDGPFSDGLDAIRPKGLSGEKISKAQAEENFRRDFADYGVKKIETTSVAEDVKIDRYNVLATTECGDVFAQYSVNGGKLLSFLANKTCGEEKISEDGATRGAEEFLSKIGFNGMKLVWNYSTDGTEYFNYAYERDGVVAYTDLVKLTVCRETGRVTAMDAEEYYLNHVERGGFVAEKTIAEAEAKVSETVNVVARGRAIVPVGNGKEKRAYEFIGTSGEDEYYVYVDADTLSEIRIYKVVDTREGRLLV